MFKLSLSLLVAGAALTTFLATAADTPAAHTMLAPADIVWGPAPPSLPPGAQAAVLYGDPKKEDPRNARK